MDVLLHSVGLEPTTFTRRLKLLLLARLIPFVEHNYNFIELGPRGTGKSYAFSEFSPRRPSSNRFGSPLTMEQAGHWCRFPTRRRLPHCRKTLSRSWSWCSTESLTAP